ncbi:hypothetical protein D5039_20505 [Verminephrobacter aporrectodeae subsp. tuberculatae]|uniref:Uncharacterized protein n=1 Tax=Verminephrobacter aporrectodeae subsp. tuberculatae TaxID=1110392 RepID=A0ABT3L042_9BURK|nr:SwmB domain-containing protein [Verminephrobacter aporrectodeae]MCW5323435.1 hypothetical protein [Verminephrobacter aporrectodeae subsp. tuberculatae]
MTSAETTVTVSYTSPRTATTWCRKAARNDAVSLQQPGVTYRANATDTRCPRDPTAVVTRRQAGAESVHEEGSLDAVEHRSRSAFAVKSSAGNAAISVNSVAVSGKTVTLTLSRVVTSAETTVTVSYTKPTDGNNVVQDAAGNDAVSFSNQAVTYRATATDNTPPVIHTAVVTGDKLVLTYTEEGSLDAVNTAAASAFAVSSAGNAAISVNSVAVSGKTVTLTLSRVVTSAETTVTVSYTKPHGQQRDYRDAAGKQTQ